MGNQAGWRTRQHTKVINRGKTSDIILNKQPNSEMFSVVRIIRNMGQPPYTEYETVLPYEDAYPIYTRLATEAMLEDVATPDTSRQILGPFGEDDDE